MSTVTLFDCAVQAISCGEFGSTVVGLGIGALSVHFGLYASLFGFARVRQYAQLLSISRNKEQYPLEFVDQIDFNHDLVGLDSLLERTRSSLHAENIREWGTFLKIREKEGTAFIEEILDSHEAEKRKLVRPFGKYTLLPDQETATNECYNGLHHYHPRGSWDDFSINLADRSRPKGWFNLLTFNLPHGPEIIGYNHRFTYLPEDKSKTKLIKANRKQIKKYLNEQT